MTDATDKTKDDKLKDDPKPAAKPKAPVLDDNVYVLVSPDDHDAQAGRKWLAALKEQSPESDPKLVHELQLIRLTDRHSVIGLYRPEGAAALVAGPAVPVKKHWRKQGADGQVNPETFIAALAQGILPAVVKVRRDGKDPNEDLGSIRLGYA